MNMLSLSEIKDIITIIVSIAAVIIASLGLRTWRKKLLGENKYELSLNVIKSLRILIDEIENFRVPLFLANELFMAFKEIEQKELDLRNKEEAEKANRYAINLRWNKVFSSYTDYESKALHLKVILDNYKLDLINKETMKTLVKELRDSIITYDSYSIYLKPEYGLSKEQTIEYRNILEKNSLVLYSHGQNNEYSKKLENYFDELKNRLKKYLK